MTDVTACGMFIVKDLKLGSLGLWLQRAVLFLNKYRAQETTGCLGLELRSW